MPIFLWNPLTLGALAILLVSLVNTAYLLAELRKPIRHKKKARLYLLFTIFFLANSCTLFAQMMTELVNPVLGAHLLPWVSLPGVISVWSLIFFAFYFQPLPRAGRPVLIVLILLFALTFAGEFYITLARSLLLSSGIVEYRATWTGIPYTIMLLAAPGFFLFHMVNRLRQREGLSAACAFMGGAKGLLWPWGETSRAIAARHNDDRASMECQKFFYASLVPFLVPLIQGLNSVGLLDWDITEILIIWTFLAASFLMIMAFIDYVPEQFPFMTKVVGISLITILAIISAIAWLIGPVYIETFRSAHGPSAHMSIRFAPNGAGGYRLTSIPYAFLDDPGVAIRADERISLPFAFPFYGERHKSLYVSLDGMVGMESPPRWRDIKAFFGPQPAIFALAVDLQPNISAKGAQSGLFVARTPEQVVITWHNLASRWVERDIYSFQLRLHASGAIDIAYDKMPRQPVPNFYRINQIPALVGIVPAFKDRRLTRINLSSSLPFEGQPGQGVVDDLNMEFRLYLNRIYSSIALFSVISTLLLLFLFPLFFRSNLTRPLEDLLHGVQDILAGRLATRVPMSFHDEIGFLARSFNEMAAAQSELIHSLEDKVAERTTRASAMIDRNARLEERDNLSHELHDAVSQTLFSANLVLDTVPALLKRDMGEANAALELVKHYNRNALDETRNLLSDLRSYSLSSKTFGQLLGDIVEEARAKYGLAARLKIDDDAVLPDDIQLTFYRLAQESLANAAKHSGASRCEVLFDGMQTQALLIVKDDGRGFDTGKVVEGHFGLQIMRERMARIGGSVDIHSKPDKGTHITAVWIANDQQ